MNLLFVLDPLETLKIEKDTSYVMMREAQRRGHQIWVTTQRGIRSAAGRVAVRAQQLLLDEMPNAWYEVVASQDLFASDIDGVLMRKDPPFDMEYIYTTYLLETLEQ